MKLLITILLFSSCMTSAKAKETWLNSFNQSIQGEAAIELKTAIMGRNRGNLQRQQGVESDQNDEHASSSALILEYTSEGYSGVSFAVQYVTSWVNYEGGSRDTGFSPAESLNLSRFNLLNEAYINYQLNDESFFRAGRQILNLNFVRGYNIRQKDQAFEALVFHTEGMDEWRITAGHLERFSSWGSRDFFTGDIENRFVDIAQVEGVNESTDGFQFIEASYSGIENLALSFYDYYGHDLYNSFGLHLDYRLYHGGWQQVLRFKYLIQHDVGRFANSVDSQTYQVGVQFKKDAFSFEVGMSKVPGNGTENNIRTPFQPNLIVEEPLFEVDLGFTADSLNLYLESSYNWSTNNLYFLVLHTDAGQVGITNTEVDLIYGKDLTDAINLQFKYAYSLQNDVNLRTDDPWVTDYRVFISYRF